MRGKLLAGAAALMASGCLSLGSGEEQEYDPLSDAGVGGKHVANGGSWASGGSESGGSAGEPGAGGGGSGGGSAGGSCKVDADCDDQNPCTNHLCTNSVCAFAPVTTDDGNPCTLDSCDPKLGIQHVAKSCDDGDACTTDTCSPSSGCTNAVKTCDDNDECTVDTCQPSSGCTFTPQAKTTTTCGTYCATGFYIAGKSCLASSCPGTCSYGFNRVTCKPICGTKLTVCDTYCPVGYTPTSTTCASVCSDSCGASGNATVCTKSS